MNKRDRIRSLHSFFLKVYKPKKSIILRFSNKMKYRGSYSYYNNKHFITLNNKDHYYTLIDSIIHEWSHLLEYHKCGAEGHSDAWAKKFGKLYRTYLKWSEINKE